MNYIMWGLFYLEHAIVAGIFVYAIFFIVMYAAKKRKKISGKCVPELLFCIYAILLIKIVGIFSLHFSLTGAMNYNIVPFVGSSFVPVLLNFVLFVPYGFLLPLVFVSYRWDWKKILCVGALTSLGIELLQMVGGRYAEIDDFLINTSGALTGYILYVCLRDFRGKRKKALRTFLALAAVLAACFPGIYIAGDNEEERPDGFVAVEKNISEVRIYFNGKSQAVEAESEVYHMFSIQMSNCGGHLLETKSNPDREVMNDTDCFIEVVFTQAQDISFENAENFSISDVDRVIYNCNENILYWGNSNYEYYVDFMELDGELEDYRADISAEYQELQKMVLHYFE